MYLNCIQIYPTLTCIEHKLYYIKDNVLRPNPGDILSTYIYFI